MYKQQAAGAQATQGIACRSLHNTSADDTAWPSRRGFSLTNFEGVDLRRCQQGDEQIVVEDWDTQEELTLPLDSTKPPVATAEALYKRARKQRRAVDHVQPLLAVRAGNRCPAGSNSAGPASMCRPCMQSAPASL